MYSHRAFTIFIAMRRAIGRSCKDDKTTDFQRVLPDFFHLNGAISPWLGGVCASVVILPEINIAAEN